MADKTQTIEQTVSGGKDVTETDAPLVEELLVEEVSIDGMCGVY